MIFVRFNKKKYIVKLSSLMQFLSWIINTTPIYKNKIKTIVSLLLDFSVLFNREDEVSFKYARGKVDSFSWLRYETDGTRIQSFNNKAKSITKISLSESRKQLVQEIKNRRLLGKFTPPILYFNIRDGIIVEEFISLTPSKIDFKIALEAFKILKERLYHLQYRSVFEYFNSFGIDFKIDRLVNFLKQNKIQFFEISPVHGDLWYGNLHFQKNGQLIILDWEYSSNCIISYDLWTYYFQIYNEQHLNFDKNFIKLFRQALEHVYIHRFGDNEVLSYHLCHLLERYRIFYDLDKGKKMKELEYLKNEINKIIKIM